MHPLHPLATPMRMSLRSRFNSECTKVLKLISSVVQYGDNICESVRQLASLAQLKADLCVAEGNCTNEEQGLQAVRKCYCIRPAANPAKMVALGHSAVYRNFYALAVFSANTTSHVSFLRASAVK